MPEPYIKSDKTLQEEILSKEINLKSWAELAVRVREKIRRLESVASAFERYRDTGEPFIGEKANEQQQTEAA